MRQFTVYGVPVAKGRPRISKWGAYTPAKTVNYENLVKMSYIEEYKDAELLDGELRMEVDFYFPIPKSTSKKRVQLKLDKKIRHTKRPDVDNLIKSVADSLNEIAYKDDNQICSMEIEKYYSNEPRAEVRIKQIGGSNV